MLQFLALCVLCLLPSCFAGPVTVDQSSDRLVVSNGYIRLEVDKTHPAMDALYQDPTGKLPAASSAINATNLFAIRDAQGLRRRGIVLEIDGKDKNGNMVESASSSSTMPATVKVLSSSSSSAKISISNITTSLTGISAEWIISIASDVSYFNFSSTVSVSQSVSVLSVRTSFYLASPSITGLFERGVVQMMHSGSLYFAASDSNLYAAYSMAENKGSVYLHPYSNTSTYALLSNNAASVYGSGIQVIHSGKYAKADNWDGAGWSASQTETISAGTKFTFSSYVSGNVHDFPIVHTAASITSLSTTQSDQFYDDIRTLQTALYGGCVGSLVTYQIPHLGSPTIASPDRSYSPLYSFYDPDNWLTVSALIYSRDAYLQNQARLMLESHLSAIKRDSGQLPHHFVGDVNNPTYLAISGATQTGPNIFWTLAALQYGRVDMHWAKQHYEDLQLTLKFLINMIDPHFGLLNSPGPLYIDVFIRSNFTADSNAALVILLEEMAEMEAYYMQPIAEEHKLLARNITANMNKYLWSEDHYITQLNPDGTKRDFIDYDANLIAVHANVPSASQRASILKRVDSGSCTRAGRATWPSEKVYDKDNCYNGNDGDSRVTMGRIAYSDAHAHILNGDNELVEEKIIAPLVGDLFKMTYLPERYNCDGTPAHNMNMHEYTELLVMLLTEISYGIRLGFSSFTIQPYLRTDFEYNMGNVFVRYQRTAVEFNIPGDEQNKVVSIYGMVPSTKFDVAYTIGQRTSHQTVHTDSEGLLTFQAFISSEYTFTILRLEEPVQAEM